MQDEFKSNKEGRPIFADVDFVNIMTPGDKLNIIDTFARPEHKARFPQQWAHYQNLHGGDSREIGTPLTAWARLSGAQAEELKALKFFTVENIANASDAAIERIGMCVGMQPHAFREMAQRFLKAANDDAILHNTEEANKKLREELEAVRKEAADQQAEMLATMKAMQEQMAQLSTKKKPGRKPKDA